MSFLFCVDFFFQVKTEEDDFETDFYKDLINLHNNENKQRSSASESQRSSHIPILFSSKRRQSITHNYAFKQAIQASHEKVIKHVTLFFYSFLKISINIINHEQQEHFWYVRGNSKTQK